jgi:ribosomal protein S12 methylthiotransferase
MKIGFLSLGCPKNLVDGEVMLGIARDAGHELTPEASEADVLVVNTCAFIDRAKQESIDAVLGTGEVPQILDAIGSRDSRFAVRDSPFAAGDPPEHSGARDTTAPLRFFRSPDAIAAEPRAASREPRGASVPTYIYDADTPRLLTTPRHFAYVKIAEGCDYTCAFCIIPTLRGHYRSRPAESIVREARMLAERGVRELLLISQDTTFYGIDRGERGALGRLLRELHSIDGLEWIRLLYLYPTTITDDVLDAMAECEKVCRYIDLPLQHASAAVLKRMRRPGTRKAYDALLQRIRRRVPGVALRTTLIVGFPGETDEDYAELEGFVADTRFDHVGVFTYSHEEGTRAFAFPDDVPASVKRRRRNALMSRQKQIVATMQKARVGSEVPVRIDGPSPEHDLVLQGRLETQAPDIDPVVFLTDCDPEAHPAGQLVHARIVGAKGYDLIATPIGELVSS